MSMEFNVKFVDDNEKAAEKAMCENEGLVVRTTVDYVKEHLNDVPREYLGWIIIGTAVGVKVALAYDIYKKQEEK
jgi:hypothetical protein